MIRSITLPPPPTGLLDFALPPQPSAYRLLAISMAYTGGGATLAIPILRITYGGVALVADVANNTVWNAGTTTVTWARGINPLQVQGADWWSNAPVPEILITPQMTVQVVWSGSDPGDTLEGIHILLEDEPVPRGS